MEFSRFDFEQQLLQTWQITQDLQTVVDAIGRGASQEDVRNMIVGLEALQDGRLQKLWDMFETGVRDRKIL